MVGVCRHLHSLRLVTSLLLAHTVLSARSLFPVLIQACRDAPYKNYMQGSEGLDICVESLSFRDRPGSKAEDLHLVALARSTVGRNVQGTGAEWKCMALKGKGVSASQQAIDSDSV